MDRPTIARHLRVCASRGKVDDADVQVLFDAADELDPITEAKVSHPSTHNQRSLAEPALLNVLTQIIRGSIHTNERQLAQMCRDLIEMTGGQPNVKRYIDTKALEAYDEASPWG